MDHLYRRRQLHKRLVAACHSVMKTGDLTEQAVAEALGKRPGATLFELHAQTADIRILLSKV